MATTGSSTDTAGHTAAIGAAAAVGAFLIWGVLPLYWAQIRSVPALEIIWHRILWGGVLAWVIVAIQRAGRHRRDRSPEPVLPPGRTVRFLLLNGLLLGVNWLVYVWAVSSGRTLDASLGYYINPLVSVLFGMVFFGERLRRLQWIAVAFATAGVVFMTLQIGTEPWISVALAGTFGLYGVIKKKTVLSSIHSLALELSPLMAIATVMILRSLLKGDGSFLAGDPRTTFFLFGASVVTVAPLLLFGIAARRIRLADVGFLQYVAPTLMFLIAVTVFRDPMDRGRLIGFFLVWTGLAIYTYSNVSVHQRRPDRPLQG